MAFHWTATSDTGLLQAQHKNDSRVLGPYLSAKWDFKICRVHILFCCESQKDHTVVTCGLMVGGADEGHPSCSCSHVVTIIGEKHTNCVSKCILAQFYWVRKSNCHLIIQCHNKSGPLLKCRLICIKKIFLCISVLLRIGQDSYWFHVSIIPHSSHCTKYLKSGSTFKTCYWNRLLK